MGEEAKYLETARADRSVWLMKCPPVVSRAWQAAASSSDAAGAGANPNPVVAKVVLSLDPLRSEEPSLQASLPRLSLPPASATPFVFELLGIWPFKMEMAQTNTGNTPKSYSLNMFKDFVPMCVFSEANQGKLSCEGKVEHKFDMKPHSDNLVNYGKLCRERTQRSMVKTRKVQVLDNDHGMSMRPMPGMVGLIPSGSKEKKKQTPTKPSDAKRIRRDRRELENIIFKLFERQPNWALKALVQETDQPETATPPPPSLAAPPLRSHARSAAPPASSRPRDSPTCARPTRRPPKTTEVAAAAFKIYHELSQHWVTEGLEEGFCRKSQAWSSTVSFSDLDKKSDMGDDDDHTDSRRELEPQSVDPNKGWGFRGVHRAIICGKVGQVPVQKILRNGRTVTVFTVGTGGMFDQRLVGDENLPKPAQWHRIAIHNDQLGAFAVQKLVKNSAVYVEGDIETRVYNDSINDQEEDCSSYFEGSGYKQARIPFFLESSPYPLTSL
ncbi:hypothetical protein ABZP36_014041 [Zizania latifolia]